MTWVLDAENNWKSFSFASTSGPWLTQAPGELGDNELAV